MTSDVDVDDLCRRARHLVESRGRGFTFENGDSYSWKEVYVGDYRLIVDDVYTLTIRDRDTGELFCQRRGKAPEIINPWKSGDLLQALRQIMILDDLAEL